MINKIRNIIEKNILVILFLMLSIVMYFVYISDVKHYVEDNIGGANNTYVIDSNTIYGEKFEAKGNIIANYIVDVEEMSGTDNGIIAITVRDDMTGDLLCEKIEPIAGYIDNDNINIRFEDQFGVGGLKVRKGEYYTISIAVSDGVELLAYGNSERKENFLLNDVFMDYSLCRRLIFNDNTSRKNLFWYIWFLALLMMVFVQVAINRESKYENIFLIIAMFSGVIMMIMFPPGCVEDECSHLVMAMAYANPKASFVKNEGIVNLVVGENDLSTVELLDDYEISQKATIEYAQLYYNKISLSNDYTKKQVYDISNSKYLLQNSNGNIILYAPCSMGFLMGRLLGVNLACSILIARLLNLITYCGIVYYAIHRLENRKGLMLFAATLPTTIHYSASLSYDSVGNAICLMYISCVSCVLDKNEDGVTSTDKLLLALFSFLLGFTKGGVYIVLGFLGILLLVDKKLPKNTLIKFMMLFAPIMGLIVNLIILNYCYGLKNASLSILDTLMGILKRKSVVDGEAVVNDIVNYYGGVRGYYFSDLLRHPVRVWIIIVRTILEVSGKWIKVLFGGAYNWERVLLPDVWIVFAVCIFVVIVNVGIERNKESVVQAFKCNKCRIIAIFTILCQILAFIFMMLAYSTHMEAKIVTSVRARYFLPLIPLVSFLFPYNHNKCEVNRKEYKALVLYFLYIGLLIIRVYYDVTQII